VPLRKEVKYLQNYLDLEELRQGQNVKIEFHVNGAIKEQQIAPLIFIPFLENSFKHGLSNQLSAGYVRIKIDIDAHNIQLEIENSKSSAQPSQETTVRSGGIGLVNVRRRLDLMYPRHYSLKIKDNPKSYTVNLTLDLDF
jgi:LytS/YehU family sensor histidine kinase